MTITAEHAPAIKAAPDAGNWFKRFVKTHAKKLALLLVVL